MARTRRIGGLLLSAAFMGAATLLALGVRPAGGGPSVLLVTFDTTRADRLGCYGYAKARTPHLDTLAREGAIFEDASTPAPITLPAHATLLTGLHPPRHGLRTNESAFPLAPAAARPFRTAAELFAAAGYRTGAFVSASPVARRTGLDAGFDVYDGPERNEAGSLTLAERDGAATVDAALGFLRSRDRSRPFFLWVHLFDPHHPYAAPDGTGLPPDSPEAYDEEIAFADAQFGRLLAELRSEGSLDRTVVVATADHGEGLGEHGESTHGYFLYRSTLRVPLLVRHPPRVPAGTRVTAPVSLADVLPTVLALTGRPQARDGAPLDGDVRLGPGAVPAPRAPVQYAETLLPWESFRWAPCCAVRDGSHRTIEYGGDRREVYDLAADPGEQRDLAAAGAAPDSIAAAGADAASLLASAPLREAPRPGQELPPELATVPYLAPSGGRVVPAWERTGTLPLPSASLVTRMHAAVAMVGLAAREEEAALASRLLKEAREALDGLRAVDPRNPAIPYWQGRAWTAEGKVVGGESRQPWYEAFTSYRDAARLGYEDAGTISLMLQAAHMARQYTDMRTLARAAVESGMDGSSDFWCWVALAEAEATRLPDRTLPAPGRAAADEALERAERRARDEADRARIRQVRTEIGR